MIDLLRDKHRDLQQKANKVKLPDKALIEEIKGFIAECRQAGKNIPNINDRAELRSILGHWGNFVFQTTQDLHYLDTQIEEPVLGLTHLRLTFEDLNASCEQRADQFVTERVREGVFKPKQAVRREQFESRLWEFLRGNQTGLVLTGAAGVGKTFLICQLAEQKPWKTDRELALILPYDCQELSVAISPLELELRDAVEHQMAQSLGVDGIPSLEGEINYIDRLLEQNNAYLLICFDAVEGFKVNRIEEPGGELREVPMVRELLLSLNAIVKTFARRGATRIKFLLTCVSSAWISLGPDRLTAWNLYFAPDVETRSLVMKEFNDDELKDAYKAYAVSREAYEEVRRISGRNPYMLRLASDLMAELEEQKKQGKEVEKLTEDLVFREFYNKRILRGTQQEQIQKQRFLLEFAKKSTRFRKDGQDLWGVSSESGDVDFSNPAYELLKLDGIIVQEKIREPSPQIVISLDPPKLAEFIQKWYGIDQTLCEAVE